MLGARECEMEYLAIGLIIILAYVVYKLRQASRLIDDIWNLVDDLEGR